MRVEIILQHGWGFDSRVWNGWLPALDTIGKSTIIHAAERGYFGAPALTPCFADKQSFKVIIAHSLGLHLVRRELLEEADAIYLLSGFLNFHPQDQLSQRRSRRVVRMMREKLAVTPYIVLRDFLKLCYEHENANSNMIPLVTIPEGEPLDKHRLLEDLDVLDHSDLTGDVGRVKKDSSIYVFHGTVDRVVSPDKSIEIGTMFKNSKLMLLESGTHALPTSHSSMCVSMIRDSLFDLVEQAKAKNSAYSLS